MQILHTGRGVPFKDVPRGAVFRFMYEDKWLVALKVFDKNFEPDEAGVMLSEGCGDLPPFMVFGPNVVGSQTVLELIDVALVPSTDDHAVFSAPWRPAEAGELELKNGKMLLVIILPGRSIGRVNVATGEIDSSPGSHPIVVTEWALVQQVAGQPVTILQREPLSEPRLHVI